MVLFLAESKVLTVNSMTLETGIFLSQAIWLWRVRHVRREAKKLNMTYDEYVKAYPSKKLERTDSSETIADIEAAHAEKPQLSETSVVDQSTSTNTHEEDQGTLEIPEKALVLHNGRI